MTAHKITGLEAIRLAERDGLTLRQFSYSAEDDGVLPPSVAGQMPREEAQRLIYAYATPAGWRDSAGNLCESEGRTVEAYFRNGEYLGPDDDGGAQ